MTPFRTVQTQEAYEAHKRTGILERSCPLCFEAPLQKFTHWKLITNNFPYDRIAATHHMLVPLRHVREEELTADEKEELFVIKHTKLNEYSYIVEAQPNMKSIPGHFHLHLLIPKEVI